MSLAQTDEERPGEDDLAEGDDGYPLLPDDVMNLQLDNKKRVLRKYMAAARSMDNEQLLSDSMLTHVYRFSQVYWSYTVGKDGRQSGQISWQGIPPRERSCPHGTVPYDGNSC